jgi:hypothetical protein
MPTWMFKLKEVSSIIVNPVQICFITHFFPVACPRFSEDERKIRLSLCGFTVASNFKNSVMNLARCLHRNAVALKSKSRI